MKNKILNYIVTFFEVITIRQSKKIHIIISNIGLFLMSIFLTSVIFMVLNLLIGGYNITSLDTNKGLKSYDYGNINISFNNHLNNEILYKKDTIIIGKLKIISNKDELSLFHNAFEDSLTLVKFNNFILAPTTMEISNDISIQSLDELIESIIKYDKKNNNSQISITNEDLKFLSKGIKACIDNLFGNNLTDKLSLIRMFNGFIQFFTVFLLITILLKLFGRWSLNVNRESKFINQIKDKSLIKRIKNIIREATDAPEDIIDKRNRIMALIYPEGDIKWLRKHSPAFSSLEKTIDWRLTNVEPSQIPNLVSGVMDNERKRIETFYSFSKYINWAIPLIGFIGTIIGIQASMGAAGAVNNPDPIMKIVANSQVTGSISIAFGTTLVALLCNLIGAFFINEIQKEENELINISEDLVFQLGAKSVREVIDEQ